MKIWIITPYNPLEATSFHGGVEVFCSELGARLSKNHEVTFIDGANHKSETAKSLEVASKVKKMLKGERPDILISNGILGWALSNLEIPRINIYHGTYEGVRHAVNGKFLGQLHKRIFLSRLEKLSGKNALPVAVSNSTADELSRYYGFPRKEIVVIEGGTNTIRFSQVTNNKEKTKLREKYNLQTDKLICLFTASLSYRKGWDIIQKLSKTFKDFLFVCTTKNFQDANIIGIEIPYSQIHEIYQLSDIYLYPSRYDGFSLGLIEAMSCGLPFIGFPSGFCRDLRNNGLLSNCIAENELSFGALLKELSCDESLRQNIGLECRLFAEKHDWETTTNKICVAMNNAIIKDVYFNVRNWPPTKKKLELSLEYPKCAILDAGCGTGWLSHENSLLPANVTAIDAAKDRTELSKTYGTFEVCRADIATLPLKSDVFDVVFCYDVLEHTPNYEDALLEFKRVLKSEGRLVVAFPNKMGSYTLLHDRLMHFRNKGKQSDSRFDHVRLHDYKSFLMVLESRGFRIYKTTNVEFLSPLFYNFRRLRMAKALSELDVKLAKRLSPEIASEWVIACRK